MLSIRLDDETYDAAGARHTLEPCPGLHREEGWSCDANCQACHLGPSDDYDDAARGTNGALAYVHLLPGARLLRGVAADLGTYSWSVRLHEHASRFTDEHGATIPVWSVTVKERSDERLHVCLYTSRADADAVYDSTVQDLDEDDVGVEYVNYRHDALGRDAL
jgi:hypothetical protein